MQGTLSYFLKIRTIILDGLHVTQAAVFRAVCKNWRVCGNLEEGGKVRGRTIVFTV